MEPSTNNVQNVIQLLKELDKTNSFDVYIPSLKRNLKFKQLNTEQLKRLLKTVIDSPVYNTEFILTFNNIIKENCLDDIDILELTILDKAFIFVKTRIESVSSEFTFNFTEDEINEYNLTEKSFTVNISEKYNNAVTQQIEMLPETYTQDTYALVMSLPIINTENKLEKELHKNVKLEINTPEELRTTLGDTFINELTKYIKSLTINETEINLDSLDFKSRVKIVEQLPTTAINKVLKYIENYKKTVNKLTLFKVPKTTLDKELPQDATFFNI
jgi:hypothetical protein